SAAGPRTSSLGPLPANNSSLLLLRLDLPLLELQSSPTRTLNMSVLIATGITAAYSFSVLLTILQSADSYYEATALLITFVLFGHWLEMRSRRGTTDALEALLQLVPPQARVLRDGKEPLIPT